MTYDPDVLKGKGAFFNPSTVKGKDFNAGLNVCLLCKHVCTCLYLCVSLVTRVLACVSVCVCVRVRVQKTKWREKQMSNYFAPSELWLHF